MRALVGTLLLAGCQVLFDLKEPTPGDAAVDSTDPHPCTNVEVAHDEDGDGFDDSCDRCPASGDAIDRDGDGDGVGDACDPQPDTACEERLLFEGFPALPPTLVLTDDWTHDGDDLLQPDPAAVTALVHYPSTGSFSDVQFRASVTMIDSSASASAADFTIASGGVFNGQTLTAGRACTFRRTGVPPGNLSVRLTDLAGAGAVITSGPFSGTQFSTFTFELVNTPTRLECSVIGPQGQGHAMATATDVVPATTGEVLILADDIAARVHWLEVIHQTCPR